MLRSDQTPADSELRDAVTLESTAEVSLRLQEAICRSEAAHDVQQSMSAEVSDKISSEFLPGFIKSGLNPVAKAIASPFAAIIGLAFSNGPVTDMMVDVVVIMIITGVVKRSMPGALKMVCGQVTHGGPTVPRGCTQALWAWLGAASAAQPRTSQRRLLGGLASPGGLSPSGQWRTVRPPCVLQAHTRTGVHVHVHVHVCVRQDLFLSRSCVHVCVHS